MRLRNKPWIKEAIGRYADILFPQWTPAMAGHWRECFGQTGPLHVELGTGRGSFISGMAAAYPAVNFVGIERQVQVLFFAGQKVRENDLTNVRLLAGDIADLCQIFVPGEINRLYINFCDPWPKKRHAKRRLTHPGFLAKYRMMLAPGGEIFFKTDNVALFDSSLEYFAGQGMEICNCTRDLHASDGERNIMTEYEQKFSARGARICRCEARFR